MNTIKLSCVLLGIAAMLGTASTNAADIRCPATLHETPTVDMTDQLWVVAAKSGQRPVEQANLYLVVNGEYGAQVPDSTKKIDQKEERVTWRIVGPTTESFAVGCTYAGTTAVLYKALGRDVRQCVASYALLPTGRRERLLSMRCD